MAEAVETTDEAPVARGPNRSTGESTARLRLAQVLAFVALVAALVGALGPADAVRTVYSWPPKALPEGTPDRVWYTPLLLIRHRAGAVSAEIPCSLPPALPNAERPLTVLATARFPERNDGLAVTRSAGETVVRVGDDIVARFDSTVAVAGGECSHRLRLAGDRWSLEGADDVALSGSLERMPVVTGLFSAVDLRAATPPPSINVMTAVHAPRPILRQKLAWTLAVLCIVAALLLVAVERRPRPWATLRSAGTGARAHAHPADAVVAVVLAGWWVLSPSFHDDGWVIARQQMFSPSGAFPAYYNAFGTNYPNDFWLEWLQHWLSESSLLVLRLPAVLCLAGVWVLCRWILGRILPSARGESRVALWALASAFLVSALAWGMTVRPEPVTALFVTAVLACTVRFLEKERAAPVALLAVLLPLAFTAHHASVAAFAPLVVVAPSLLRWARASVAGASTIVASSIALLALLLFVGSDLEQRRDDAGTLAMFGAVNWRSEIVRYSELGDAPYATPLRRASVALIALALLAFLLRSRRDRQPLLDLPAASLGVALLLFVAAPSKWPWHFGALLGLLALAVASETARLRRDAERSPSWWRPLVAIGAATLAIAWSWSEREAWSTVDLRTLDWTPGFERVLPLSTLGTVLPLVLLGAAVLVARSRRSGDRVQQAWRVASWTPLVLAVPMLTFTVAVLALDTTRTETWTLARQNLGAFRGDVGCGLADDLLTPTLSSAQPLVAARAGDTRALPSWVPPAPVERLPRFSLGPAGDASVGSPWFGLPIRRRFGLFVAGRPGPSDRLGLEWGRLERGRMRSLGTDQISTAFASEAGGALPWRFVAAAELPAAETRANVVRVTLRGTAAPSAAVAVTAPVAYANERLARRLSRPESRPLVFPNLVSYFPCVALPRLRGGIAEVPSQILVPQEAPSPVRDPESSPFIGVLDLYGLERLPTADSANPQGNFAAFEVDQRIPGALEASPEASTRTAPG